MTKNKNNKIIVISFLHSISKKHDEIIKFKNKMNKKLVQLSKGLANKSHIQKKKKYKQMCEIEKVHETKINQYHIFLLSEINNIFEFSQRKRRKIVLGSRKLKNELIKKKNFSDDFAHGINGAYNMGSYNYKGAKQYCEDCDKPLIRNKLENSMYCKQCGDFYYLPEVNTYQHSPNNNFEGNLVYRHAEFSGNPNNYQYKRLLHLNEKLLIVQGRENIKINVDDVLMIERHARSEYERYISLNEKRIKQTRRNNFETFLTYNRLKSYIKKLRSRLSDCKLENHIFLIYNRITGSNYVCFSEHEEKKIQAMFKQIQLPISLYIFETRKNFPSYWFILRKIVERLGIDVHLKYFPLLKSEDKNKEMDMLWKYVCEYIHIKFKSIL